MKRYIIKRTVIEMYEVLANSKKEALDNMYDPWHVQVKSNRIISIEEENNAPDDLPCDGVEPTEDMCLTCKERIACSFQP